MKKSTIIVTAVVGILSLVGLYSSYAYAFREMEGLQIKLVTQEKVEQKELLESIVNPPETSESTEESQESTYSEQKVVTKPQPVQQAPVQQKAQVEEPVYHQTEPERIPFTNNPVVPGNPESYIGTYGQCPFYENAGEKGCYPPADIECNADWSVCKPREA